MTAILGISTLLVGFVTLFVALVVAATLPENVMSDIDRLWAGFVGALFSSAYLVRGAGFTSGTIVVNSSTTEFLLVVIGILTAISLLLSLWKIKRNMKRGISPPDVS